MRTGMTSLTVSSSDTLRSTNVFSFAREILITRPPKLYFVALTSQPSSHPSREGTHENGRNTHVPIPPAPSFPRDRSPNPSWHLSGPCPTGGLLSHAQSTMDTAFVRAKVPV